MPRIFDWLSNGHSKRGKQPHRRVALESTEYQQVAEQLTRGEEAVEKLELLNHEKRLPDRR